MADGKPPRGFSDEELAFVAPGVDRERLLAVVDGLERRRYAAGEAIIRQGEAADAFYVVVDGAVEVLAEPRSAAAPRLVERLTFGEFFGEIGLVHGVPRTATVRAAEAGTTVVVVDRDSFEQVVTSAGLDRAELARLVNRRLMCVRMAASLPRLLAGSAAKLLEQFRLQRIPPGGVIVREGDEADAFFIVAEGRVQVWREPDRHVAWLEPGDYFGEIGLLQGSPRTASVRADPEADALLMVLDRNGFTSLLLESSETGRDLVLTMYRRLLELAPPPASS